MKRFLSILSGIVLMVLAGCVDINDAKVQVQRPGEIDPYKRNVLDKCPPHTNLHRLVMAKTGSNSILAQGGTEIVYTQKDFDQAWSYLSAVDDGNVALSHSSREPVVTWNQ